MAPGNWNWKYIRVLVLLFGNGLVTRLYRTMMRFDCKFLHPVKWCPLPACFSLFFPNLSIFSSEFPELSTPVKVRVGRMTKAAKTKLFQIIFCLNVFFFYIPTERTDKKVQSHSGDIFLLSTDFSNVFHPKNKRNLLRSNTKCIQPKR